MITIRTILFNILFYGLTALACLLLAPLVLFPRDSIIWVIRTYIETVYFLERTVLGLNYEIRGKKNLPKEGPYIVAAKHQSAYETLKLHKLFADPSIVLKKELLSIPIWGWFLGKLDVIAIDRQNREQAMASIIEGSLRMKEQGRPIVIFPQGTRVKINATAEDKPYKGGIVKMYESTGLPIVPMALNSGLFWGRNSFIKRPGKVVFEFLPPIEPGLPEKKVIKALEERLETASISLMDEAKEKYPYLKNLETPQ